MNDYQEQQDQQDQFAELKVMEQVARALETLKEDKNSILRVLRWANDRFGLVLQGSDSPEPQLSEQKNSQHPEKENRDIEFQDFAEMFAEIQPSSDAHKALVASYWLQYHEGQSGMDTQKVNTMLKHLGYGVTNITRAFDNLIKTRPALVVQLRKAGSSKQARKTLKVTHAGKKYVEGMLKTGTTN